MRQVAGEGALRRFFGLSGAETGYVYTARVVSITILGWCGRGTWTRVPLPKGNLWRYKVKNWLWLARRRQMK